MNPFVTHVPVALLLLLSPTSLACAETYPQGDTTLTVVLHDGRTVRGQLDTESSAQQLVVRIERQGIVLWRTLPWSQVASAEVAGRQVSGTQLHSIIAEVAAGDRSNPFDDDHSPSDYVDHVPAQSSIAGFAPVGTPAVPPRPRPPRVRSLQIEPVVANWDADVEVDGLAVRVVPLDSLGNPVAVTGTITVELIGNRPASLRSKYVYQRGHPFPRLGRWTRRLQADRPESSLVKLPFRADDPQFDLELGAWGLVHARLVVPGQGVFEASADLVRIRPYSPLRDWRQQVMPNQDRYFPEERLGRTQ